MVNRPKLLDLFCGAGGAAMGYYRAGFEVVGIDIKPQPHYPFEFHLGDALTYPLEGFDAYHASPPCQGVSIMRNLPWLADKPYEVLIAQTRNLLRATNKPYVIENVYGARYGSRMLKRLKLECHGMQAGYLCGAMFGLQIYFHRLFETNVAWLAPGHPKHTAIIRRGHQLRERCRVPVWSNGFRCMDNVVGNAKGIDWMGKGELSQAVPPAYTEYIGKYLMQAVLTRDQIGLLR